MNNILLTKKFFNYLKDESLTDQDFLEHFVIPHLGLNNEILNEQPEELSRFFGAGLQLKIWQYPNQFAPYLLCLSENYKKIKSYMEIGCRHGGTFILHCEYLSSLGSALDRAVAIDIVDIQGSLIDYCATENNYEFIKMDSSSEDFIKYIDGKFFDLIFIDGDHSYEGVKKDAENTREISNIQVFHDIVNTACPGVVSYWEEIKETHKKIYDFYEFKDQYESVGGSFLGIGVAVRKKWLE
jgi:hypothetical protein